MHEYKCKLVKIIDGDTIDVDIDLGFDVWLKKQRIRLYGIDTPESRTSDDIEKIYGTAAKNFLIKWTGAGDLTLKTYKDDARGKFGRILGEIWTLDTNINEKMIEKHHAVKYHGQSKDDIEAEHIKNRELVILNE